MNLKMTNTKLTIKEGVLIRSCARWISEEEKSTFFNILEKCNYVSKQIIEYVNIINIYS